MAEIHSRKVLIAVPAELRSGEHILPNASRQKTTTVSNCEKGSKQLMPRHLKVLGTLVPKLYPQLHLVDTLN